MRDKKLKIYVRIQPLPKDQCKDVQRQKKYTQAYVYELISVTINTHITKHIECSDPKNVYVCK